MNEKGALNLPLIAAGLGILPKTVIEQALPRMFPRDADLENKNEYRRDSS